MVGILEPIRVHAEPFDQKVWVALSTIDGAFKDFLKGQTRLRLNDVALSMQLRSTPKLHDFLIGKAAHRPSRWSEVFAHTSTTTFAPS